MAAQYHWNPETYLDLIRSEVPRYDELQDAAIAAIPFPPARVLELGIGTGETARRLTGAYPGAEITGLDSSPDMVYRARELGIEARLARMEDPLPDGPWDLVISVLSVHHLPAAGKRDLFRRVREQSRALVLGDVVDVPGPERIAPIDPELDFPETVDDLVEWTGGAVAWAEDDLAVVAAEYG